MLPLQRRRCDGGSALSAVRQEPGAAPTLTRLAETGRYEAAERPSARERPREWVVATRLGGQERSANGRGERSYRAVADEPKAFRRAWVGSCCSARAQARCRAVMRSRGWPTTHTGDSPARVGARDGRAPPSRLKARERDVYERLRYHRNRDATHPSGRRCPGQSTRHAARACSGAVAQPDSRCAP